MSRMTWGDAIGQLEQNMVKRRREGKCSRCYGAGYEWGLDGRDGPCRWCDAPEEPNPEGE